MTETDILGFDPQDLFKKEEKPTQAQGNTNIYRMRPADSKSEDGIYRATIKVIDNPVDRPHSFLDQQSYAMSDARGFFSVVSSLTVNDKSCPIFTAWKKCRYAKKDDGTFASEADKALWLQQAKPEEGGAALFDKRSATYCIVQILEDENQPELVGSFKLWKIPAAIHQLIKQKQDPTDLKKCSIPVTDCLYGRAIDIEVHPGPDDPKNPTRKTREITYTGELSEDIVSCINPDGSPILTSDEQEKLEAFIDEMKAMWKEKDAETRKSIKAEILASDAAKEFAPIYKKVIEQIKGWAPALESLSYHEWNDDVKARVQAWIDIVLAGGNPVTAVTSTPAPQAETVTSSTPSSATVETPAAPADETSDLPF